MRQRTAVRRSVYDRYQHAVGILHLWCIVLPSMLTGGCAKIVGVDSYKVGPTSVQFYVAKCGSCAARQCEAELRDCEGDPACRDQATCLYGCGGDKRNSCAYDCLTRAGSPRSMKALVACTIDRCTDDCGSCSTPFNRQGSTCGDCVEENYLPNGLCERANACLQDAQCRGFTACLFAECDELGEPDTKCRLYCGGKFPDGARRFYKDVGYAYVASDCRGPCDAGNRWHCPQQPPVWPYPYGTDARLTLRLTGSSAADAGATMPKVRVCNIADDLQCAKPYPQLPTDAAADALFVVSTQGAPGGPVVFFDIQDPAAPVIFAPWQPVVGDLVLWAPGGVAPAGLAQQLSDAAAERGETVDIVGKGLLEVWVVDCAGATADFQSSSPRTTITTSTGGSKAYYGVASTGGGYAHFINVPPGSTSVEVSLDGEIKQAGRVPVRAGTTTVVTFNYPQFL